jgi:hypothetical protein
MTLTVKHKEAEDPPSHCASILGLGHCPPPDGRRLGDSPVGVQARTHGIRILQSTRSPGVYRGAMTPDTHLHSSGHLLGSAPSRAGLTRDNHR